MIKKIFTALLFLVSPIAAFAHPGHETVSFMAGLLHPLLGFDHLMIMVAVGYWAAKSTSDLKWETASAFIALMMIGFVLGSYLDHGFVMESAIALSVCSMAMLIALAAHIRERVQIISITAFGLLHGIVHGQELLSDTFSYQVMSGVILATMILIFVGLLIGHYKNRVGTYLNNLMVSSLAIGGLYFLLN